MHHFFFLLDHSSCYCPSSNSLFGYKACAFILVPGLLALQHMNICFDRGSFEHTSNFFKSSKNPSGKTLQNCFIHKSSTASYSYYSPPLVGTSHEEDTITTNFGRNKNAFCWLIGERTKLQRRTQMQRYRPCLPVQRLPRPSRSMQFGDVSDDVNSLGPLDPKRIGRAQ